VQASVLASFRGLALLSALVQALLQVMEPGLWAIELLSLVVVVGTALLVVMPIYLAGQVQVLLMLPQLSLVVVGAAPCVVMAIENAGAELVLQLQSLRVLRQLQMPHLALMPVGTEAMAWIRVLQLLKVQLVVVSVMLQPHLLLFVGANPAAAVRVAVLAGNALVQLVRLLPSVVVATALKIVMLVLC